MWRNRDYLLLWGGQTVSAIGSQFSSFVLPLLILALTHSPAQAGFVGAAQGVPYVVLSLPAGAVVDRLDRKALMVTCDALRALNMFSVPVAAVLGHLSVIQLYAVALIEGTLFVFFNLAEMASLPRVVPPELLPAALARQETTWGISALLGPPLAGLLYQAVSYALPFVADGVSYVLSALSLWRIRTRFQTEQRQTHPGFLGGMGEALSWLWHQPLVRLLALVTAAGDFLFSGIGLIPLVIARQQMHASPLAISLIFTLAAVGGIAGSALSGQVQRRLRFAPAVISTEWLVALLYPLLAVAPNPLALGAVRTAISAVVSVSNPIRLGYQAALIPDALQGRVNSVTTLFSYGALPLGQTLTGVLLQSVGSTRTILLITACLLVSAAAVSLSSTIRHASPAGAAS